MTRKCHPEAKPKDLAGGNMRFFAFPKGRLTVRSERLKNGVFIFNLWISLNYAITDSDKH